MPTPKPHRTRGFTLIELVVAIVIIGISVTGVLLAYTTLVRHSADPMITYQAVAIAEAYLEEIGAKSYYAGPGNTRDQFDDVFDYNGLSDSPPRNSAGVAIGALSAYSAAVAVSAASLGSEPAARIDVTVTHPNGVNFTVTGYRTGHY